MNDIVVLGTGCAAWGAHRQLKSEGITPIFFDKNTYPGGHTASFSTKGFVFDDGPHISFTEDVDLQNVFADAVDFEFESLQAKVDNWYYGSWVKHTAITDLHALPADLIVQCLTDFIQVRQTDPAPSFDDYHQWLRASYGETFADKFPAVYGKKYHTCDPADMNTSWLGPRLYRPSLEEVLAGAVADSQEEKHYVDKFRYPKQGGFVSYLQKFIRSADVRLGHKAVNIDATAKVITFENGRSQPYDRLISSAPLPEMVRMIADAPSEVVAAAELLSCSQCVTVNFGVDREDLSPSHWRYIYDIERPSVRLSFPHMFSPSTVPDGCGAVQVEVYYSNKYKPLDHPPEDDIAAVKKDLLDFGVLRDDDQILVEECRYIEYANVIFDHDSDPCANLVKDYLSSVGIEPCGRYGDWAYIWTDQSFASGENAAQRVVGTL
jgi:protoporphyrinogen oxidase